MECFANGGFKPAAANGAGGAAASGAPSAGAPSALGDARANSIFFEDPKYFGSWSTRTSIGTQLCGLPLR